MLIELLIQDQLQPALARIDYTNLPKHATKPMLSFLISVFLGRSLFLLFLPLYIILIVSSFIGWDTEIAPSQFKDMSAMIDMITFVVIPEIIARSRMRQLEQRADSVWGVSSQKDIDFCNHQFFTLKVGVVYLIAFSAIPLVYFLL